MDDDVLPKDLMNIVMEYAAPREDQNWCDAVYSATRAMCGASFEDRERCMWTWDFNFPGHPHDSGYLFRLRMHERD